MSSSFQYPTRPSLTVRLLKVAPLLANVWLPMEVSITWPELCVNVPPVLLKPPISRRPLGEVNVPAEIESVPPILMVAAALVLAVKMCVPDNATSPVTVTVPVALLPPMNRPPDSTIAPTTSVPLPAS